MRPLKPAVEQRNMIKFCEPLSNLKIHKGVDHVFEQTMAFAKSFNIKLIDDKNHKIILDQEKSIYS